MHGCIFVQVSHNKAVVKKILNNKKRYTEEWGFSKETVGDPIGELSKTEEFSRETIEDATKELAQHAEEIREHIREKRYLVAENIFTEIHKTMYRKHCGWMRLSMWGFDGKSRIAVDREKDLLSVCKKYRGDVYWQFSEHNTESGTIVELERGEIPHEEAVADLALHLEQIKRNIQTESAE